MTLILLIIASLGAAQVHGESVTSIYDFAVRDIDGNDVSLGSYRDQVVLIVNVASRCAFTPQYEGLQAIYDRYKDQGFTILGFPANNFLGQEPGTNAEIKTFCTTHYAVTFPMFSKISVKGGDMHPLYRYLTGKNTNPKFAGSITWNFNKFLLDRNGAIIARFKTRQKPESKPVVKAIENALR